MWRKVWDECEGCGVSVKGVEESEGKCAVVWGEVRRGEHGQLTAMQTDREKQLRKTLYYSKNTLHALNNMTRLENRLTARSTLSQGLVRVRFG